MEYRVVPLTGSAGKKEFHKIPHLIYQGDPHWVCPLEEEVDAVFDPQKNPRFREGAAQRWILKDAKGNLCGRVAAFYNDKMAAKEEVLLGGMGFFECIDDKEAAFLLFDTAREWLKSKGMVAMEGPVNFGENDSFWGLLVEGFTHPSYGMNYHKPYYTGFFEDYGFVTYYEQVSKHLSAVDPMPARFRKIAEWVGKKPGVRLDYARKGKQMTEVYGPHFMDIYNEAWKFHEQFTPLKKAQVDKMVKRMMPVIIERFMVFAYVNDEPAAFLFALPDLNQIFKPFKGKFPLHQKLLFLWRRRNDFAWYRKRGILDRCRVIIIGVKPKFQKYGLESAVTMYPYDVCHDLGFREVELSWVGDFNPMSRKLQDATGAVMAKRHRTMRIHFSGEYEWKRREALDADPRKKVEES